MSRIKKIDYTTIYTRVPIRTEIAKLKNLTKEQVKELYGSFGLDIYEKKNPITILSDKEYRKTNSLLYKIITWFTGSSTEDFKEEDTLKDVVFKYVWNKKAGLVEDIETKFGKKGKASFDSLCRLGYVDL